MQSFRGPLPQRQLAQLGIPHDIGQQVAEVMRYPRGHQPNELLFLGRLELQVEQTEGFLFMPTRRDVERHPLETGNSAVEPPSGLQPKLKCPQPAIAP